MEGIYEILKHIQSRLKVGKTKTVSVGGSRNLKYRTAEQIMEAVKPLLQEYDCILTMNNEPKEIGGKLFCISTATLSNGKETVSASGFAREGTDDFITKKWQVHDQRNGDILCESQSSLDQIKGGQGSGAAISYAEKYALGALFLIDDGIDLDSTMKAAAPKKEKTAEEYAEDIKALAKKGEKERALKGLIFIKEKFPNFNTTEVEEIINENYGK